MRFLLLSVAFVVSSWAWEPVVAAQSYYVTDEIKVVLHRGPSREYKIKAWVTAGTPLTVLGKNSETGFYQVRTDKGTVGWLDPKNLKEGRSIAERLPKVENELQQTKKQLSAEQVQVTELKNELASIKEMAADKINAVNDARAKSTAEVAKLENEINRLQSQIDSMDETNMMGWMIRGGLIAFGGVVLGLIIPNLPKRRRRTDEWF